jgi:hypothetical protein
MCAHRPLTGLSLSDRGHATIGDIGPTLSLNGKSFAFGSLTSVNRGVDRALALASTRNYFHKLKTAKENN